MAGARDAHELGACDRRGDPFRRGRHGDGILLADHDQGGRGDAGKLMIDGREFDHAVDRAPERQRVLWMARALSG